MIDLVRNPSAEDAIWYEKIVGILMRRIHTGLNSFHGLRKYRSRDNKLYSRFSFR